MHGHRQVLATPPRFIGCYGMPFHKCRDLMDLRLTGGWSGTPPLQKLQVPAPAVSNAKLEEEFNNKISNRSKAKKQLRSAHLIAWQKALFRKNKDMPSIWKHYIAIGKEAS